VVTAISRAWAWIRLHPLAADTVLMAALLIAALVSSNVEIDNRDAVDPSYAPPAAAAVVAGVAPMIVPLALRRVAPLSALLASIAGFLLARVALDTGDTTITTIALSLSVYSAAAHGHPRWRNWVCGACLVAVMAELWREVNVNFPPGLPNELETQILALVLNLALFAAMWALGAALGTGRRRARELEHEREENARRAVFDERVRIARELHDVVAHHVSMMGVQAGAARVVIGRDPAKAKQALGSIEGSSRQAVTELHRLLGFLRQAGDPDALAPQPGLGALSGLAARVSDAGVAVEIRVQGEQRPLPATVDVSAYRIVQEALTNTVKHAGASRADVHLRYWPDELELEVVDDGRKNGASRSTPGGLGVVGMRERAALLGGELTAGPAAGGGFAVRVRLPTPEGAL
jgi:signal transduction histidine kinase